MTQNEKDLLLKDLCARLPYGVKVLCLRDFNHTCYNLKMIDIEDNEVYLTIDEPYTNRYAEIKTIKPYLFPLSSMNEEQKEELNNIFDLDVEIAITHIKNDTPNFFTGLNRLNWFIKNHFDIYGLIPMGLAIDATGKNIY